MTLDWLNAITLPFCDQFIKRSPTDFLWMLRGWINSHSMFLLILNGFVWGLVANHINFMTRLTSIHFFHDFFFYYNFKIPFLIILFTDLSCLKEISFYTLTGVVISLVIIGMIWFLVTGKCKLIKGAGNIYFLHSSYFNFILLIRHNRRFHFN